MLVVGAIAIIAPGSSSGHSDTPFTIHSDGFIEGVPDEYAPVYVRVGSHRPFPWLRRKTTVDLQFGGVRRALPHCLARLFRLPDGKAMTAYGSWYHDLDSLPPYLSLDLPQWSTPDGYLQGYSLTLSLDNGAVLILWEQKPIVGVQQTERIVDLNSLCSPGDVENATRPIPE